MRYKTSPFSSPSTPLSTSISNLPAAGRGSRVPSDPSAKASGRQADGGLILVRELLGLEQTGPCPEPLDPAKEKKCAGIPRGVYGVRRLGAKTEIPGKSCLVFVLSLGVTSSGIHGCT